MRRGISDELIELTLARVRFYQSEMKTDATHPVFIVEYLARAGRARRRSAPAVRNDHRGKSLIEFGYYLTSAALDRTADFQTQ
ncbi:hypothetical protein EVAR_49552_1 [Eumeta japonica]|uniref:Uncharacterized protein n=1 Tax=Eumeta variegata TaxID=151549 RepID=A0A4C1XJ96_EUMVA|nr:hypothetical protein EVAR_49552_1 [Eumeta japonica]